MNRQEALDYIRNNSRLVRIFTENLESGDKSVFEQRMAYNGKLFFLHDMGEHGWDMFYRPGGITIDSAIEKFNEYSNIKNDAQRNF